MSNKMKLTNAPCGGLAEMVSISKNEIDQTLAVYAEAQTLPN